MTKTIRVKSKVGDGIIPVFLRVMLPGRFSTVIFSPAQRCSVETVL